MKRSMKFRPQANQIEAICKRHAWASLALVGISDADVLQRMLFACTRLRLTVVATWPEKSDRPGERIKQTTRADKVRQLSRSYASRVTLLECTAGEAAHKLCGQVFDGAVLFDAPDLESDGGAWAALARSGGMLLGTDHRDMETRATLNAVAPGWERLDDGLWCVRVKRADGNREVDQGEPVDVEPPTGDAEPALPDGAAVVHDPVSSTPSVDDAVHEIAPVVAGAEGGLADVHLVEQARRPVTDEPVASVRDGGVEVDEVCVAVAPALPEQGGKRRVAPKAPGNGFPPKPALPSEISGSDVHAATIAPKRRGGRPKGAKNKPKVEV
jgi:hypothetical protein